jgi:hypothetical protein
MPNNFPEMPFDESIFDSNDLMREYWERTTESRVQGFASDIRMEETHLTDDLAELHRLTVKSFPKEEVDTFDVRPVEHVVQEEIHVVEPTTFQAPELAVVEPLLVSSGSGMSGGAILAVVILTILLLYIVLVATGPLVGGRAVRY